MRSSIARSRTVPLVIHNTSEHALWLNSAAMRMAGLTTRPLTDADEERGVIRDASGNPSGVLLEAAMQIADRAVEARVPLEAEARDDRGRHALLE